MNHGQSEEKAVNNELYMTIVRGYAIWFNKYLLSNCPTIAKIPQRMLAY